jgi:hypothetical protein
VQTMFTFTSTGRLLVGGIFTAFVCTVLSTAIMAQQNASPPDFSSNRVGWVGVGGGGPGFAAVPGRPSLSATRKTMPNFLTMIVQADDWIGGLS